MSDSEPLLEGLLLCPFSLDIDFTDHRFIAVIKKNGGPATYEDIRSCDLLSPYFGEEYRRDLPGPLVLSPGDADRLIGAIRKRIILPIDFTLRVHPAAAAIEFKTLNTPFFSFVYHPEDASFRREIPDDALSLGNGYFLQGTAILKLPEELPDPKGFLPMAFSGTDRILGEDILALAAWESPLVREKPLPENPEDRPMELRGAAKESGRIRIALIRRGTGREEWLPLAGLPNHRLRGNRVVEIIGDAVMAELFREGDILTLTGEEIPLFIDTHSRLIAVFGDEKLRKLLDPVRCFIREDKLSLVLRCTADMEGGVGRACGIPALKYGKKRCNAREVSERLGSLRNRSGGQNPRNRYLALDDRWVRRETLEGLGLGPLGFFIDGGPIQPLALKPGELLCRGSKNTEGFWTDCELDLYPHTGTGNPERTFTEHLDFLRRYGIHGGVIAGPGRVSAALLADYLFHLSGEEGMGRVLVLLDEGYWDSFLVPELGSHGGAPNPREGASLQKGRRVLLAAGLSGIDTGFYTALTGDAEIQKTQWDILILVNPEDSFAGAGEDRMNRLRRIRTRLKLGILANDADIISDPHPNDLKIFFGIRGKIRKMNNFIFQSLTQPLPLPAGYERPPMTIRRPPKPFDASEPAPIVIGSTAILFHRDSLIFGGARFTVQRKFQSIGTPEFKEEQECFLLNPEEPVPVILYHETDGRELRFARMNQAQRRSFLYWRGAFRKGRILPTFMSYMYLYARELLLSMGNTGPMDSFRELLRLWRSYRGDTPDLDYYIPNWLTDFAVLYGITDTAMPELLPYAGDTNSFLLKDLYLHKQYIEEDNPILLEDIVKSLDEKTLGLFFDPEFGERVYRHTETALGTIDRFLRETTGKRFFEFFYPSLTIPVLFEAFNPFNDMGFSSYTAEWIHFWRHKPLLDFLQSLITCIDLRLREAEVRERSGGKPQGKTPPENPWKNLIDRALGFSGAEAGESGFSGGPFRLQSDRLTRIRNESDEVRGLLRIDEGEDSSSLPTASPIPEEGKGAAGGTGGQTPGEFLTELGEAERAILRLIAEEGGRPENGEPGKASPPGFNTELGRIARQYGTMPEILIDNINEGFQQRFGDLLIDIREGLPVITEEYGETLAGILKNHDYNLPGRKRR
ncbi:MAG: TerB N-terminal domain-containing protein [Spirochaetaceae bacterium]|jgi:hypothetical protein|nr:TerB N-terminal domain-containing protein [Spirochaetaceae bacterium]